MSFHVVSGECAAAERSGKVESRPPSPSPPPGAGRPIFCRHTPGKSGLAGSKRSEWREVEAGGGTSTLYFSSPLYLNDASQN